MRRRIIGIDLDDVLLDFNNAIANWHNLNYKTSYKKDDVFSFNLEKIWKCSRQESTRRILDFYQSDFHKNALPIPGATEATRQLKKNNDLVIITSKPDYLKDLTTTWIEKHFPESFKSINFTGSFLRNGSDGTKAEICEKLGVQVYIDDHIDYAKEVASPNRNVLLFDSPWNQGDLPENITRVYSWEEIAGLYK